MDLELQAKPWSPQLALICASVVASLATTGGSPAAEPGQTSEVLRREGIRWPGEGGKRLKVSLGVYLIDFAHLNLREESFDMAGYLDVSWTDPGLALKGDERKKRTRRYKPGQVWSPALEFVNAVGQVIAEREGDIYTDDDGRSTQRVRFSHKFQSPLDLKRFTFDSQSLVVVVSPFDPFAKDLGLEVDQRRGGEAHRRLRDGLGSRKGLRPHRAEGRQRPERRAAAHRVEHRSSLDLLRVARPATHDPAGVGVLDRILVRARETSTQISTGLAILLSLVTFNYAIDFSLPEVAYLTFIDRYTLTAFAFVLARILTVSVVHVVLNSRGLATAARVQAWARIVFPVAFLSAIGAISELSFR